MTFSKRPISVTGLIVSVLILLVINLIRLFSVLDQWAFIASQNISASPIYLAATGLFWSLFSGVAAWGLIKRLTWASNTIKTYSLLFGLYYWFEQIFILANPLSRTNWFFKFAATLALTAIIYRIISRAGARAYLGEEA